MTIPERIVICDREFCVLPMRRPRSAGGAKSCWPKQTIHLYYADGTTTCGEMMDSLFHEVLEMFCVGSNVDYMNGEKRALYILTHDHLAAYANTCAGVLRAVMAANGAGWDSAQPYSPKKKPGGA